MKLPLYDMLVVFLQILCQCQWWISSTTHSDAPIAFQEFMIFRKSDFITQTMQMGQKFSDLKRQYMTSSFNSWWWRWFYQLKEEQKMQILLKRLEQLDTFWRFLVAHLGCAYCWILCWQEIWLF
jgi:hypothetical protein